jgi:small subunit ribosomal protein S9
MTEEQGSTTETAAVAATAKPGPVAQSPVRAVRRGEEIIATGRRKTAVARVRLRPGSGEIVINGKPLDSYFPSIKDRMLISGALEEMGKRNAVKIAITVDGGGSSGQAGACRLGIARALKAFDAELAEPLRQGGLLTRDGRMKERKKYGLRGARRGTQFSKR